MEEESQKRQIREIGVWWFVWLCIKEAARGAWHKADSIAVFVGLGLGAIAYFIRAWEKILTRTLLIVPLAALASVIVVRLLFSPLLVYRKRDAEAHTAEETIKTLTTKPKRTPAQQYDYDVAKKALQCLGQRAVTALRHLREQGKLILGPGTVDPQLLADGIGQDEIGLILTLCENEGLVTSRAKAGSEYRTYEIAPRMIQVLDELLYE